MREFHINRKARDKYGIHDGLFCLRGRMVFANLSQTRDLARRLSSDYPELRHQDLFAMGLIDEVLHYVISMYGKDIKQKPAVLLYEHLQRSFGKTKTDDCIRAFCVHFPPNLVYRGQQTLDSYLVETVDGFTGSAAALEEILLLWLENQNPAYQIVGELISDVEIEKQVAYSEIIQEAKRFFNDLPPFGPDQQNLMDMLRAPALAFPNSLEMQLEYIRTRWGYLLGDVLLKLLRSIDFLKEANAYFLRKGAGLGGKAENTVYSYGSGSSAEEYERFSPDRDWMPKVVLLAKTTLVWLFQLSQKYKYAITRLDQIPDEELDLIASRGFNSLWLIGLWERSDASRKIKHRCGNPDAASSAYSLYDYDIAKEIGAWGGLENLRHRAMQRGIRLASDMVPNHTGIESRWVTEHPDWYVQVPYSPFPGYSYNSESLSSNSDIGIHLEDHYYDKTDAAVTFKRVDHRTGDTRYIYHGNDGTHMPWNDTAQLDFTLAHVREAVIQTILHVAKNFPIIRFDAAMTLAKRHIQRLWFPEPGSAGDIPSRAEHGMSAQEFNQAIPIEFWREVVDRVAVEAPDTLLLAEAFWMMEGYFVRTLGMHRVYNSAFMNMLKAEENAKYRQTIKNTISFDKDILKRFVNFMNNPDEETALAQFGDGDKYFGVCTLMATMPGLPMFGHGQVEGLSEKYGMEYRRAYKDEVENRGFVDRHYHDIFPLLKKRYLFADVDNFYLFDLLRDDGSVNENVFAYSNAHGNEHALIVYNNAYDATSGTLRFSNGYLHKSQNSERQIMQKSLAEALSLNNQVNCYTIFRELRSNLWYIRQSNELHQHGMRILLNGYQAQVYLDIHEVHDNDLAHYRMLHEHLAGKGVPDIQEALRELVLKPIIDAFASDLNPVFWADAVSLFDRTLLKKEAIIDSLTQKYQSFIFRTQGFAIDQERYAKNSSQFKTGLESLVRTLGTLVRAEKDPEISKPNQSYLTYLHTGMKSDERRIAIVTLLALAPLYPENETWQLQYKVNGISGFNNQISLLAEALKPYIGMQLKELPLEKVVLSMLEVQEYLGVHYYDAVRWYNKERFEEFIWWFAMFRLMAIPKNLETQIPEEQKMIKQWQLAHEQADFRYELLKQKILKTKTSPSTKELKPKSKISKSVKPSK